MSGDSILGQLILSFTFGLGMVAPAFSVVLVVGGFHESIALPISVIVGIFAALYALEREVWVPSD